MKKITLMIFLFVFLTTSLVYGESVEVTIPEFDVTVDGQAVDNENNAYPLIVYNDITYFPMTWNFTRSLGLKTDWHADTGLVIGKTDPLEKLQIDTSVKNDLSKTYTASVADFKIGLNNKTIDNKTEKYPILLFRDVTYFPLTWRFAVEEFGWKSDFNPTSGLNIVNNNITNNVTVDQSSNNTTTVTDVENSSVVVNNNNIDNSVNDSNNVYNDYSTHITNNIDNSVSVTTEEKIDLLLEEIMKLKSTGGTSGNILVTYLIKDQVTGEPIQDAVVYMNDQPVGISGEDGLVKISVFQFAQYSIQIEHQSFDKMDFVEAYNDSSIVEKKMRKDLGPLSPLDVDYAISEAGVESMVGLELEFETLKVDHSFKDPGYKINSLEKAKLDDYIYIRIDYMAPEDVDSVGMRFAGDKDGLWAFVREGQPVVQGRNVLVFKISRQTLLDGKRDVCLEVGDEYSVTISYIKILKY
ncbi:hypothetical protein EZV73_24960 [Acidaminobacter sp. JC074]|uniref:hypothetical protein n=1 Tax=Acidaminobacter sp. JC074 TaxID=2530199 RepID=UPI001F0D2DE5|nr:hypothetical protein [Acidaminobacter sp. JC074]MCH4890854.1 hypothetical protein [Acidaminobacter sp. JC074]